MAFIVGPGILKRMGQMSTQPASDEIYVTNREGRAQWSEAMGLDGKAYRFLPATNQVLTFNPSTQVQAGSGPDPTPSIPKPVVIDSVPGVVAGTFVSMPLGVVLHSTRSGQNYSERQEFDATVNFVRNGAGGLGWNVGIGPGIIATHIDPRRWGWNCRGASSRWLSAEFAQSKLDGPISDEQVTAFCWWLVNVARAAWPNLPATFTNHSSLPEGIADGKTDPEPRGQHSLRDRILAVLR